jgi:3-hydroxymyristoyl/3-hydroxydecanoyl-(acyl carrier protein) dehydratase
MDIGGIMDVIPHRYPFLLVDRVLDMSAETGRVVAIKNVTGNEDFFAGTAIPAMPLYLLLESAAQAACALALSVPMNEGKIGYFMAIDEGIEHRPVVPGDRVVLDIELNQRGRLGFAGGKLSVGQDVVTELTLKFVLVDRE